MNIKNGCISLDGTDMYFVSFGSGDRKLVVLPGLSDGLSTVKGKALLLASPYRSYLKDYTVFIFSRKNPMPKGYSIRDMAHDQVLAMTALSISRASVLGVSQGGMIAQCIAIEHPEIVDRLILAVTAAYANVTVQNAVEEWIGMAERADYQALMLDTAEKTYSHEYLDKNRRLFPLLARVTKPKSYDRFLISARAILSFDVRGELADISCPTLIIAGDDDHIVGTEAAYQLKQEIPDSELYIYRGLGHGAYEEAKDFYDRVLAFCRKDQVSPAPTD